MIQINNTKNKKINNLNLNFLSPSSKKMLEIKLLPEVKTLMITHQKMKKNKLEMKKEMLHSLQMQRSKVLNQVKMKSQEKIKNLKFLVKIQHLLLQKIIQIQVKEMAKWK